MTLDEGLDLVTKLTLGSWIGLGSCRGLLQMKQSQQLSLLGLEAGLVADVAHPALVVDFAFDKEILSGGGLLRAVPAYPNQGGALLTLQA
jgi:hypothetical protein